MRKIKVGDEVIVIAGKDKGKKGPVLEVIDRTNKPGGEVKGLYVRVEGVNLLKKHEKGNPQANKPGGIIEKEGPLHISNVSIFNPTTGKADRVGFKVLENGKKARYFKSNSEVIE